MEVGSNHISLHPSVYFFWTCKSATFSRVDDSGSVLETSLVADVVGASTVAPSSSVAVVVGPSTDAVPLPAQ